MLAGNGGGEWGEEAKLSNNCGYTHKKLTIKCQKYLCTFSMASSLLFRCL